MEPYTYFAKVRSVVDGDTLDLSIDLGFSVSINIRVRLFGVDTPEKYGVKVGSEEHTKGIQASEFTDAWVASYDHEVMIRSHSGKKLSTEKYGRWLADVYPASGDGASLNEALVQAGLARSVSY